MAIITLKSRKDPIEVPNEKAKGIKARWAGIDVPKASSDDVVDLGWITFQYGQLKTIEMTNARKTFSEEDFDRPLTEQEKKNREAMMTKVRKNLELKGLVNPKIANQEV